MKKYYKILMLASVVIMVFFKHKAALEVIYGLGISSVDFYTENF